MTTHVVLVPGFWLGPWAWDEVAGPLRAAGLVPHAVDLPGLSPQSTPESRAAVTREDHLRAVQDVVTGLDGPVVLVGHSGGGALVGEVLDRVHAGVAHVVYVDSGPLVDGARLTPPGPGVGTEIPLPAWDELAAQGSSVDGIDDAGLARFRELAQPQPAAVATTPVQVADPARLDIPATAVCTSISARDLRAVASHDAPFHTELLDVRTLDWVDLPTGHWPMLSRPADLAGVLVDVARSVAPAA
ncbi:alpha/beta fold hydrolase [Luteimicrobium subarcticum]|uniref:Alpha/beta hydrolase family protein n=1 Tax=Luteimicrobium subarcticum TaxID=620910 RepID=A0A2M8WRZ0_9MICO|nr:alpha/beta hydrolase [Luteimicrobium subarcticum]PJI93703.1 alpha/beta hydrolase family protein [Luteimicrobium subarcticum]